MSVKLPKMKHRTFAFKAETVTDAGRFEGYLSVFGNVDSYGERVMPGAFADSIAEFNAAGDPLPCLWQHQSDNPIGGFDYLAEDDIGLRVKGFLLVDEIQQAKTAHSCLMKKVVRGMSIGYYSVNTTMDEETGIRDLNVLDLQEGSIVTFPANELALVDEVKNRLAHGEMPSLRDFESSLRELGFSKRQAAAIATHGFKALLNEGELRNEPNLGDVKTAEMIRDFVSQISPFKE